MDHVVFSGRKNKLSIIQIFPSFYIGSLFTIYQLPVNPFLLLKFVKNKQEFAQ